MKIAILTFFESENYGTVLQAYATQKYLEGLGHTAELIHLKRTINGKSSHYASIAQKASFIDRIKYKTVSFLQKKNIQRKSKAFEQFRKEYLRVSKYYESVEALKKDLSTYDLYISGGDQIWNPYHKVFSTQYMFDFLPDDIPRVAYGSSFGVADIAEISLMEQMKNHLSKYRAIGVREQSGVDIIASMGLQAVQVLDPVFLLKDKWDRFVGERPLKKKYCLVYALIEYPQEEKKKIKEFARERGLDVVILPFNRQNCLNGFHKQFGLSPQEFLNYIAHAEYVFTNSFHGLAFSILFQKQFTVLGCASEEGLAKRERVINILKQFEIHERSFNEENLVIDYALVNKKIEKDLLHSKIYIDNAINN